MHTTDHSTYTIQKATLRRGAAIGVLVLAAGLGLGTLMHTSSQLNDGQPVAEAIDISSPAAGTANDDAAEALPEPADQPPVPVAETDEPAAEPDDPAEPEAPADEPSEEPEDPADEPVDPEVDPDLVGPDGLTIPWPVPDPTPIPPVDDLTLPVPLPDPTPVDPICCITIEPVTPDPDPVPPVWVDVITLGD